jgi:hypothetical protein
MKNSNEIKSIPNIKVVETPIPTSTSIVTPKFTPSKFVSRYVDSNGNLHEVTDYSSQGGSRTDVIIETDTSITDAKNKVTLQDKLDKQTVIDSGILGTWINEIDHGDGTKSSETYYFGEDLNGYIYLIGFVNMMNENNVKTFFKYKLQDGNIILSNVEPCTLYEGCDKQVKYKFMSTNELIIDDTVYERQ